MKPINRRKFITSSTAILCSARTTGAFWPFSTRHAKSEVEVDIKGKVFKSDAPERLWKWSHEGFSYKKIQGKKVVCRICPNRCILSPGDRSVCRSKVNMEGTLYSLAYGNPCAVHIDPVEKKPLYHFKPTTAAFSLATAGCNLRCLNCQNWEISQAKPHEVRHHELFPDEVIKAVKDAKAASVAYTYSEPITFYEYMWDIAHLARDNNINNLLISNGYINHKPLLALCSVLDAANVNIKSFRDDIYRNLNGGKLQPVLKTLKTLHDNGIHFEMTNLVVPGYVDDENMVTKMCHWILESLGPDYPLHFLRFFPRYKLDRLPPTPVSTLTRFRQLAMDLGIHYVYIGNVPGHDGNHTYCHSCKKRLVERQGYYIPSYHIDGNRCKFCGTVIPGVWSDVRTNV